MTYRRHNFVTENDPPFPLKIEPVPVSTLLARVDALVKEEMAILWENADNGFIRLPPPVQKRLDAVLEERAHVWHLIRCMHASQAHYSVALPTFLAEVSA